ncbi:MAG: flagellar basal-body rod protein FlgG [Candidatus Fibromonas sp.]|jgi:flagellar basal-body rod protein FlgG|nr:flagellar basal-body rod protein FlgG [Candidatus Fibromonas sp.]
MIRSLYTAATGMKGNQTFVDTIAHNLSNVNTTGYKKQQVEFEDLIYQSLQRPGGELEDGNRAPVGIEVGLGARVVALNRSFLQGNPEQTGNETDVAIMGHGFFQVRLPDGEIGYTRNGAFKINDDGYLTTSQGYYLDPPINIPDDKIYLVVSQHGEVTCERKGAGVSETLGQIELARFINPAGLTADGGSIYRQSDASGSPIIGLPGEENFGTTMHQYTESSNVQMVEEMVHMIVAQRAYEISSKAITTSDEMLQTANSLKR